MSITTINPANGSPLQRYELLSDLEIDERIASAQSAWQIWRKFDFKERKKVLLALDELFEAEKEELAHLVAMEMGKPIAQGISEIEKCAWVCRYYANETEKMLGREYIQTEARQSFVSYQPLGVLFAIMPWNFPFWQVMRFTAPALMAGNAVLLKHAPNVTGCALKLQQMLAATVPDGLFSSLVIDVTQAGWVIADDRVRGVTLTGSGRAGSSVASLAGKHLKKSVLELGGSDPYVIMDDADIDMAVETCVTSRLLNSGQTCISAKRFIMTSSIIEEFTEKMVELMRKKRYGDPLSDAPDLGPMAREDLRAQLHEQVQQSVAKGAKVLLGAELPAGSGWYYPPTVLMDVVPGMPAYDEELFGPVASIIEAKDEHDAMVIANDTSFGLGAAIFSSDERRALRLAEEELQAGCVFINDFVKSDPRLPFGGIKASGFGRELGLYGVKEWVNAKTVYLK